MLFVNPKLISITRNLNRLKKELDTFLYCNIIGEGLDKYIYYWLGSYEMYIGYIPGLGYKMYLMSGIKMISDPKAMETVEEVVFNVISIEKFRDDHLIPSEREKKEIGGGTNAG